MMKKASRGLEGEQGYRPLSHGPRLTHRDQLALTWISEHSAIRFDHLQRLLAHYSAYANHLAVPGMLSEHSTRRVLGRWRAEGLVAYKIFRVGEKGWIWLAEWGHDYLGLERKYRQPLPSEFEQLFKTNEAWLREGCQLRAMDPGMQ